ncbi:MAG TPA: oligoendopeptidase F, partial [Caulobacteraceae bacterium]
MNAPASLPDAPPRWRLDDLYASRSDPRIETDLAAAETSGLALASLQGAFAAAHARPAELGELINRGIGLYEDGINRLWPVAAYASLAASAEHTEPAWARFEADVRARAAKIDADTLFFTLELNSLEDGEIAAALEAHPAAALWSPWLRRVRLTRPHELSPDLERMLIDRAPAVANWSRLYDDTLARLVAKVGRENLTLSEALNRLSDPAPARRRAAADGLAKALADREETLALAYNTLAAEKQLEDRWRRFADPAAPRHLANEVDAEAVVAMESAVVAAYPALSHRYYRLKAKAMGVPVLDYWDRNAPLTEAAPRLYGWSAAKALVLDSFAGLAPRF